MPWTKPEYLEIILGMEATAYVNTDDAVRTTIPQPMKTEEPAPVVPRENA